MRNQSILEEFNQEILKSNKKVIESCPDDKKSRIFFLKDFIRTLVYCYLQGIKSLRLACRILNHKSCSLKLKAVAFSTLRDAFNRFDYEVFKKIFFSLALRLKTSHIPEVSLLKHITLVDGSVFPLSMHAHWAEFRKNKKAAKLHLAWNLNQMVVDDLLVTEAKGDEKKTLRKMIRSDHIYVLDRGYVSFDLFRFITEQKACFVCRGRKNLCYEVLKSNRIHFGTYGKLAEDCVIQFHNDPERILYRLVYFKQNGSRFYLLTNDFSLTVEEVVLLYASRWQVELVFKFIKRTLNGIHAYSESENGLYIQFYMIAIISLLMVYLKQSCQKKAGMVVEKVELDLFTDEIVTQFGERLKRHWKIGIHWLTVLRLNLNYPLTKKLIQELARL